MRNALFSFTTPNLGDDLQALSAALFLGRPSCYVIRERLDQAHLSSPHRLIMNSWFAIDRWEAVPHQSIDPIFFGFCVGRRELLNDKWLSYLRGRQPIGCRDTQSVEWLQERGIDSHMTGCITLWLGRRLRPIPRSERSGIYMVDVPSELEHVIPQEIRKNAIRLTNAPSHATRWGGQKERFRQVARICDILRGAELVLTRRLHTMLPCIGFQTPVVGFIKDAEGQKNWRFGGYESFVPMVRHNGKDCSSTVTWDKIVPAEIPAALQQHFVAFERQMEDPEVPREHASLSAAVEALIPDDDTIIRYPLQLKERVLGLVRRGA